MTDYNNSQQIQLSSRVSYPNMNDLYPNTYNNQISSDINNLNKVTPYR